MPNPTTPPNPLEEHYYARGGREVSPSDQALLDEHGISDQDARDARLKFDRSRNLPLTITANPSATPGGENIKLRPTKRDDSLILVIDRQRSYAQIEVTEPNVEALWEAFGRWLGK